MFLLDTNVVSEMRRKQCNKNLKRWIFKNDRSKYFISVVTIYEIQRGICAKENKDPVFAHILSDWIFSLKQNFNGRILSVTEDIAQEWGRISYTLGNINIDNLIAATAKVNNLIIATRNTRHFEQTGVSCVNPWEA